MVMGEELPTQILLSVYLVPRVILQNPLPLPTLVVFFPFSFPWEQWKGLQTSPFYPTMYSQAIIFQNELAVIDWGLK